MPTLNRLRLIVDYDEQKLSFTYWWYLRLWFFCFVTHFLAENGPFVQIVQVWKRCFGTSVYTEEIWCFDTIFDPSVATLFLTTFFSVDFKDF